MFVYLLGLKLRRKMQGGHIYNTCCALGAVGIYCVQQFVFVTVVANRPCVGVGVEGKLYYEEL